MLCFFIFSIFNLNAQTTIRNSGALSNKGIIKLKIGSPAGFPDTLRGKVEFADTNSSNIQIVPNIVYDKLAVSGGSVKLLDSLRNEKGELNGGASLDSLIVDERALFSLVRLDFNAKAAVCNTSGIVGNKFLKMNSSLAVQSISGGGLIERLEIDNPNGVFAENGGTLIGSELILRNGEMSSEELGDILISDSAMITRYAHGKFYSKPQFLGKNSVKYLGNRQIETGREISDDGELIKLFALNDGGIVLTKDLTVTDSLVLYSEILTETETHGRFSLTLESPDGPQFLTDNSEIKGTLLRKALKYNAHKNYLNNRHTFIKFNDLASANGAVEINSRVVGGEYPAFSAQGEFAKRAFSLSAQDADGNKINGDIVAEFGFGWRRSAKPDLNECIFYSMEEPILVFCDGKDITGTERITSAIFDAGAEWAHSAAKINRFGEFGIANVNRLFAIAINLWLEGAYRNGKMDFNLSEKELLPKTPPDIFPYNLDNNRSNIVLASIPDSVVDWVVIELRNKFTVSAGLFKTCLLKSNGTVVTPDGSIVIDLSDLGASPDSSYYIAVLHRNHLAVITEEPLYICSQIARKPLDFSEPKMLMGREAALKVIPDFASNSVVFAIPAGDATADGVIDERDYEQVWLNVNTLGYLIYDFNLDGIANISDFNASWNNRGRSSFFK